MPLKSKKKLFEFLSRRFNQDVNLDNVDNETYGSDSRIYLFGVVKRFGISRLQMERELVAAGFRVHKDYWPGSDAVEISVSYFKGENWDE